MNTIAQHPYRAILVLLSVVICMLLHDLYRDGKLTKSNLQSIGGKLLRFPFWVIFYVILRLLSSVLDWLFPERPTID